MVEAGHHQSHRPLQHDGEGADHQAGHRFLDDHHVEIAIEQAAPAFIDEEGVLRMHRAHGDFRDHPRKDAAFEDRQQIDAQRAQPRHDQQQRQQHAGQDPQGRDQRGTRHRVDQQLHGDGGSQRQQADRHRIDDPDIHIAAVRPDDLRQPRGRLPQAETLTRQLDTCSLPASSKAPLTAAITAHNGLCCTAT